MKIPGIKIDGFKIDKSGKLVRNEKHLDLCTQLKRKRSKRVRYGRKHVIGQQSLI